MGEDFEEPGSIGIQVGAREAALLLFAIRAQSQEATRATVSLREFWIPLSCEVLYAGSRITRGSLSNGHGCCRQFIDCSMDTRTPEKRTQIMRAVRTANTGPEIAVRSILHALGYRFRLNRKGLPGRPDIVLPEHKKVIFVHGCFWHGHRCDKGRLPKSRLDYWGPKIVANKRRDRRNIAAVRRLGWQATTVWQCELKDTRRVLRKLTAYMGKR